MATEFPLEIEYEGGQADDNRLYFYDGSQSLFGYSRAIQIAMHYIANRKVAFQAPSTRGFTLFLEPFQTGSFDAFVRVVLDNEVNFAVGVSSGMVATICYDFVKVIFNRALGRRQKPITSTVDLLVNNSASDLDALAEALDGPLLDAHRTIYSRAETSKLHGQGDTLATLDEESYDYLRTRIVGTQIITIKASVAAYNVNSRKGRLFDLELGRTIPFEIDRDALNFDKRPLSWSLDRNNNGYDGTIEVDVKRQVTLRNETKKYYLVGCRMVNK